MYFNGPLVRSTSNPIVSPGLAPKTNSGLVHLCKHGNNIDYRCSLTSIIAAATSIATFRKRFLDQLKPLFVQVLILAHEMGLMKLGKVSLDGTKIKANASKHHALSWGHACKLEKQLQAEVQELMRLAQKADSEDPPEGMDIPEELSRLLKLII